MAIDLSDYESGAKYRGDYNDDLAALQERLSRILVAHIVHKQAQPDRLSKAGTRPGRAGRSSG